ncbi:hypothetical protein [Jannaschia ovalis]|uniref:Lipoprotein n=1 Tax=Jannaschia ovalis TaxID=3038773 RepID=A0ABY8LA24_9RHOB|nr:hypothetical protein [Jannaschia sp. GRR-S6-38]WGH77223.1 hypothetical protein P8627_09165 [Jannaschia sp. GRR-S6-38]
MFRAIPAALAAALLAQPAAALSCLAPTMQGSFQAASDSEATYVLARGIFAPLPDQPEGPEGDPNDKQDYSVETLFTGQVASAQGFVQPARTAVTIEIGCEAAWCGAVPEGEVVALIERREDRFVLEQGPCPRFALTATDEVVNAALACARGEACEAPE